MMSLSQKPASRGNLDKHDASEAVTFSEIATEFVVQSRSALMEDELCGEET